MPSDRYLLELIREDQVKQARIQECLNRVTQAANQMKAVVERNPEAVANFLSLRLVQAEHGGIATNSDGSVYGRFGAHGPVGDRNLHHAITSYQDSRSAACRALRR